MKERKEMMNRSIKQETVLQKENVLYLVKEVRDNIVIAWLCYGEEDEFVVIRSVTRHIGLAEIKDSKIAGEAELITG